MTFTDPNLQAFEDAPTYRLFTPAVAHGWFGAGDSQILIGLLP